VPADRFLADVSRVTGQQIETVIDAVRRALGAERARGGLRVTKTQVRIPSVDTNAIADIAAA